jgi:hypothetical protein
LKIEQHTWHKTVIAGIISGLLLGIGGRVVMWMLALIALGSSGFSLGGTFEVIATGLLFGIPGTIVYKLIRKRIGSPALWKAAFFGLSYFIILVIIPPPAAVSASSGLRNVLTYTLTFFGLLFVFYGITLELLLSSRLRKE